MRFILFLIFFICTQCVYAQLESLIVCFASATFVERMNAITEEKERDEALKMYQRAFEPITFLSEGSNPLSGEELEEYLLNVLVFCSERKDVALAEKMLSWINSNESKNISPWVVVSFERMLVGISGKLKEVPFVWVLPDDGRSRIRRISNRITISCVENVVYKKPPFNAIKECRYNVYITYKNGKKQIAEFVPKVGEELYLFGNKGGDQLILLRHDWLPRHRENVKHRWDIELLSIQDDGIYTLATETCDAPCLLSVDWSSPKPMLMFASTYFMPKDVITIGLE